MAAAGPTCRDPILHRHIMRRVDYALFVVTAPWSDPSCDLRSACRALASLLRLVIA